eukprot:8548378-Lingulodinium_polyedra.AAC.1
MQTFGAIGTDHAPQHMQTAQSSPTHAPPCHPLHAPIQNNAENARNTRNAHNTLNAQCNSAHIERNICG